MDGYFRIGGTGFAALLSDVTRRERLRAAMVSDVSTVLQVTADGVIVYAMGLGSLTVNFTVTSSARRADGSTVAVTAADISGRMQVAALSATWLSTVSTLYAETSSDALSIQAAALTTPTDAPGGSATTPSPTSPNGGISSSPAAPLPAAVPAAVVGTALAFATLLLL